MSPAPESADMMRVVMGLMGLCSGLIAALTLSLKKSVKSTRQTSKENQELFEYQRKELIESHKDTKAQVGSLMKELNQVQVKMGSHGTLMDQLKKAFEGYFQKTNDRIEKVEKDQQNTENRLKIVEVQSEQVIKVGKDMVARIKKGG